MSQSSEDSDQFFQSIKKQLTDSESGQSRLEELKCIPPLPGQCLYVVNWRNQVIEHSVGIREMLGYDKEEFTFEFVADGLIHPDDRSMIKAIYQKVMTYVMSQQESSLNHTLRLTYRIIKQNGQVIKVLRHAGVCTADKKNRLISNYSILTDISDIDPSERISLGFISREKKNDLIDQSGISEKKPFFTPREQDILKLLKEGFSSQEISEKLFISLHTTKTHRKNMLKKAQAKNNIDLIFKAWEKGYL